MIQLSYWSLESPELLHDVQCFVQDIDFGGGGTPKMSVNVAVQTRTRCERVHTGTRLYCNLNTKHSTNSNYDSHIVELCHINNSILFTIQYIKNTLVG